MHRLLLPGFLCPETPSILQLVSLPAAKPAGSSQTSQPTLHLTVFNALTVTHRSGAKVFYRAQGTIVNVQDKLNPLQHCFSGSTPEFLTTRVWNIIMDFFGHLLKVCKS